MHAFPDRHLRSVFRHRLLALGGALAVCASCASPCRAPLCDADVAASVQRRATSVQEIETALRLADLGPLAVPRPTEASLDTTSAEFWYAAAYLYEPGVRQARRRLEARRALARGAGAVPSIDGALEHVRLEPDFETEAMATIDLLALLGVGPAAAAKELARAEVCEALGDLEMAVWSARWRVLRARVRLAAAIERELAAAKAAADASDDDARIRTIEEAGRGAPAEFAWARATVARIDEDGARARIEAAQAREELARATGLAQDRMYANLAPPFRVLRTLDPAGASADFAADTDAHRLLARLPSLRAAKLEYAVAEARVRTAAAATWPGVALGPKIAVTPDHLLSGGILGLTLPLPNATQPALCAALIERTAAREAVEDALQQALARSHAINAQLVELRGNLKARARERQASAEQMWRAARAKFLSDETALTGWILALEMRVETALAAISTGESVLLTEIDAIEASGPDPESGRALEDAFMRLRALDAAETRPQ